MQKKIIALAVAGLVSGAAFAQSNVTVYGVMDMGQAWVKTSTSATGVQGQGNVGRLDSNSSNIGFKGVEDLGGGLKALFQIESSLSPDATGGTLAGRDTYLGLTGGFGTVVAGNLTHPLRAFGNKAEVMPGGAGIGTMHSVYGTVANAAGARAATGADDRATNAIAYVSPNFSGFTGTVAYVNGENKTNAAGANVGMDVHAWQLAGEYANGPLNAGLGYHSATDWNGTAGAAHQNAKVWRAFATYDFGVAKLGFLYDNTKVDQLAATSGLSLKRNAYGLSLAVPFAGNQMVGAEYARSGDVKRETGDVANSSSNIFSLVYTYSLSKRTMVHARYSKLSNDSAAFNTFYNNAPALAAGGGSDSTGYMVGLRHSF